jgi:hypothetical protein
MQDKGIRRRQEVIKRPLGAHTTRRQLTSPGSLANQN